MLVIQDIPSELMLPKALGNEGMLKMHLISKIQMEVQPFRGLGLHIN